MLIKVDDQFRPFMNDLDQIEVDCETVIEGLGKWLNMFPQLQVYLLDNEHEVAKTTYLTINDHPVLDEAQLASAEPPFTVSLCAGIPHGAEEVGNFFVQLGLWFPTVLSGGLLLLWDDYRYLQLGGLTMYNAMHTDVPDLVNGSLNNSAIYTFQNIRNTTASGTPINIVYGAHRLGGHVLNIYTTSQTDATGVTEILYAQVGICEGEVESISNVEVEKNPAKYYNAVEIHTKNGSEDQGVMENFNKIENTTSLNRRISNTSEAITSPAPSVGAPTTQFGIVENGQIQINSYKIPRMWVGPDIGGGPGEG